MSETRSWVRPLSADARIYVETEGRPFDRYVVALQLLRNGRWQTIRLLDNAHGEHDLHRYTGSAKQPAERFMQGTPQKVLPQAIRYLTEHWEAIARSWSG
jgi:hypothetical protein